MQVTIDSVSLHVDGHGSGDPILLVHGFPLTGEMWRGVLPHLEPDHRLIVPDLRGHGRSGASAEASMARYADDLAAVLDAIEEARPVVLVGMSMGGYVAFEFYRRYQERVRAVVLTNTRAQADTAEEARKRIETAAVVERDGSRVVAEAMVSKLFSARASDDMKSHWRAIMAATDPVGVAAALRAMAARPDSFDTLASMGCPVLVVAGEEDAITPVEDALRMVEAARDARLVTLAGAGHMGSVERPETFADAVRGFIEGHPGLPST